MQRKTAEQSVERLLQSRAKAEAEPIRTAMESFTRERAEDVRIAYEYAMTGDLKFLNDRDADLWLPLFAVCSVVAPDRIRDLQHCAEILCGAKQTDDADDSLELALLVDLRKIWPDDKPYVETSVLLEALRKMEESPWYAEVPLTARKLARMMSVFHVKPLQFRDESRGGLRGYSLETLKVAWRRYL